MPDAVAEPPAAAALGLRRRRRAVPDERPTLQWEIVPNAPAAVAAANQQQRRPRRNIQALPQQRIPRRRHPPSDMNHVYRRRFKLSHMYCFLSAILAAVAIVLAPSPPSPSLVYSAMGFAKTAAAATKSLQSAHAGYMEQVSKASVGGGVTTTSPDPDDDAMNLDMMQTIQRWFAILESTPDRLPEGDESQTHPKSPQWWMWWARKDEVEAAEMPPPSFYRLSNWIDADLLQPTPATPTNIIDKILTSTPRLLAIANFLLAMTYLTHSAVAAWFLGGRSSSSSFSIPSRSLGNNNDLPDWTHHSAGARERMGGFLVFKLLLVSAVVAPDTLDLLILLTWYTLLSCLRSLDHLAHATTNHMSALGQPPRSGVLQLLLLVLFCDILAAASCVALFHAAGWGMVCLLTCDCALLAADVVSHMLKHCQCVLEDRHSQIIQDMEARQLDLHQSLRAGTTGEESDAEELEDDFIELDSANSSTREGEDIERVVRPIAPHEIQLESRLLDREMEVLDLAHARQLSILDASMFALDLICYILTVAHFCHIWSLHGIQFTLIDGVLALHLHSAISSACKKIAQRRNVHIIARDLQGLFPNASDQELRKASLAGDVCCICLGTMSTGGHVKKVRCGHLYHTHCLREVVERAHSIQDAKCPLCRASVLDGRHPGETSSSRDGGVQVAPGPVNPAVNDGGVAPGQGQPVVGEQALFRFSTDGILPAWLPIPAFSFEVVRRSGAQAQPVPATTPHPQMAPLADRPLQPTFQRDAAGTDGDANPRPQVQAPLPQPAQQQSFLRRILILAGAIPMTPEEEARALSQLVDMFPQYDRSDLLRELRERGSSEAVAEAIIVGVFSGIPRGD